LFRDEHTTSQNQVTLYSRDAQLVESVNTKHLNSRYLKDTLLPENLKAIDPTALQHLMDNWESSQKYNVYLMCIPTQSLSSVLLQYNKLFTTKLDNGEYPLMIMANKGIENESLNLPIDIIRSDLGDEVAHSAVFLSGPSFAIEIVERQPTCVTVASDDPNAAIKSQLLFHAPHFRVYTSSDPVGVEVAGALKNVVAIASGVVYGLGYQMNARAALLTRGLAEITRVGKALNCKDTMTFAGLSGIGDLFLTCTSEKSRNFSVGYRMAKYNESLSEVIENVGSVAEGVPTTKAAYELCRKLNVRSPIIDAVYSILYQDKPLKQAVEEVLSMEMVAELSQ
jgi:glycerol-3-phosphate dehydrogenase